MSKSLLELSDDLRSWVRILTSENKSPETITVYRTGVTMYLAWCARNEISDPLDKAGVQEFLADLLDRGLTAKTVTSRLTAIRRFAHWLHEEGEIDSNTLVDIKQPKVDKKVVEAFTDNELRDLFKACSGKRFADRRDEAIARLMAESTMRAGEILGLGLADVDLDRGIAIIRRGKGGRGRAVPFGPHTGAALDRYIRARRHHTRAHSDKLWLGAGGPGTFGYYALRRNLTVRARKAGVQGFHLHRLRHTAATRWLRAGGSEGGLMTIAGWSTRSMLDRYTAHSAAERAADEAKRLNLGDL
jgi:site-specific recombinase XerD